MQGQDGQCQAGGEKRDSQNRRGPRQGIASAARRKEAAQAAAASAHAQRAALGTLQEHDDHKADGDQKLDND